MLHYCLSNHAVEMKRERDIHGEWIDMTIENPDFTEHRNDGTMHYLRSISDKEGRFLRVIVNPSVDPCRVITLFFDRRIHR